jgi:hypothetical protein
MIYITIAIRVDGKQETPISIPPSIFSSRRKSCYFYLYNYSINVLKVYHAIESHLRQFPSDAHNFPNFDPKRKPILARGSTGPLEGDLHSAEYFHGRYASSLHHISTLR